LLTELCEDLADQFDVTVIAGQPNYNPENSDYRARGVERRRGMTIRRVLHTRLSKASLIGRGVNFVTFIIGAFLAGLVMPRPDVVVVETDPPLLCLLGSILRWVRGCRLVVYLQDIHPDIAIALGKMRDGWLTHFFRQSFLKAYRRADRIVVLSDDMRSLIVESGVPDHLVATIPNWVDTRLICPIKADNRFRAQHGLERHFVVMYSGNLGLCQQLDDVLLAANELGDSPDVKFVLVGQGASRARLELEARRQRLENVLFLDYQPKQELSASLSAADLHLVPLDARLTRYMMPSKLYGILSSGTPLIAVASEECELSRLVRSERIGVVSAPGQPQALASQIRQCAGDPHEVRAMGGRARQLAVDRFDRRMITAKFARLLADVGARQPTTAGDVAGASSLELDSTAQLAPEAVPNSAVCRSDA